MLMLLLTVTGGNLLLGFGIAVAMGHGPRVDIQTLKQFASVPGMLALLRGKGKPAADAGHGEQAADSHGHAEEAKPANHGHH